MLPQTIYPTRLTTTTNSSNNFSNNFIVIASSVASSDVVDAAYHLPSTTIGVALGSDLLISHTTVMNAV
ncbi:MULTISPECIES: hypothetical protein [Bacillus cereus group]|uniref:hypothetical protein n=1 Tax=Bacillus cereus group TaxID=86661 RepID=UPI0012B6A4C4|nr:hypothetical protein [Bacillus thuringiensis]MDZ4519221.1 hypothetical protein [Bacillus cereus]